MIELSSTNKTPGIGLNSWVGTDVPKMEDFNEDNNTIDYEIASHKTNEDIHTTAEEKEAWNMPYVLTTYTGNGATSRNIKVANFEPSWGIVFRISYTPSVVDIDNRTDYNFFGIFTNNGSNAGLSLSGKNLTVQQSSVSVFGSELKSYNENGASYMVMAFR